LGPQAFPTLVSCCLRGSARAGSLIKLTKPRSVALPADQATATAMGSPVCRRYPRRSLGEAVRRSAGSACATTTDRPRWPPQYPRKLRCRPAAVISASGMVRPCSCPSSKSGRNGHDRRSTAMSNKSNATIATMGVVMGKNSFHVVGLDQRGAIVLRQKWSRGRSKRGSPTYPHA
jgi:hypothetical protein